MTLKDNLENVEEKVQKACERAGRKREDVTLIAVSKTKPIPMLEEVYGCGIRDFGENKVQELAEKCEKLPKDIHWHMIGHLQRNKIKYVADKACLIHSVDSVRLAEALEHEAKKRGIEIDILLEVNMAKEESKFGFMPEEAIQAAEAISRFSHLHIKGLMTIAPFVENPQENRVHFANLRKLSVDIANKNLDNAYMGVLSMGMTNDYEVAIEEGATCVRVGAGIFGEREYKNRR